MSEDIIEKYCNRIPKEYFFLAIVTIGFCIVFFGGMFTGYFFGHDGIAQYIVPEKGVGADRGTWLLGPLMKTIKGVAFPWGEGVISTTEMVVAVAAVKRMFGIEKKYQLVLLAGTMCASPAVICSNLYVGSTFIYYFALMMAAIGACLCYEKGVLKFVAVLAFICCAASYTAYINFALSLVIIRGIINILNREKNGTVVKKQIVAVVEIIISLFITYAISLHLCKIYEIGLQERVGAVAERNIETYLNRLVETYLFAIRYFCFKGTTTYYYGLNFKLTLVCIIIFLLLSSVIVVKIDSVISKGLFIMHLIAFPLSINFLGIVAESHILMTYATISMWILFLIIGAWLVDGKEKEGIRNIINCVVVLCCIVNIAYGWRLATVYYAYRTMLYERGYAYAIDLTNRIEDINGYEQGKTPILFVGSVNSTSFAINDDNFSIIGGMGGTSSMFTTMSYFRAYVNGCLGHNMNILNPFDVLDAAAAAHYVTADNNEVNELYEQINKIDSFPSSNCYFWYNNTIFLKVSDDV